MTLVGPTARCQQRQNLAFTQRSARSLHPSREKERNIFQGARILILAWENMCSAFGGPLGHICFYVALCRMQFSFRPQARGGIENIGDVPRTCLPERHALTKSGLAVVNAPFRSVWFFLCPPTLPFGCGGLCME